MTGRGASLFGQPAGLTILFLTEMWEKFSYYGMRALLVYYMTKELQIAAANASLIYGAYTAFAYLTPIAGGVISDRWLGRRRAVILGGSIMAFGHFLMVFEAGFYPALVTIALGNGLFLPSLPSQIGSLYADDDPRRGSAYNVYYVGINLGALLAPLGCGTAGELFGWHYGFGLAGIGMVTGLVIYVAGRRHLPPQEVQKIVRASAADRQQLRGTIALLFAIGLCVVVLRSAYEQLGNTIALWADSGVDRTLENGFTVPRTWFQALNPLLVFLLTPLLVARWSARAQSGREPSPLIKMSWGALCIAAAYLLLAFAAWNAGAAKASALWLVAFFVVFTFGELHVLPIGLGLFARLAPAAFAGTVIAAWFLASFAGNLLAGVLGTVWTEIAHARFFLLLAGIACCAALLFRLLDGPARRVEAAPR